MKSALTILLSALALIPAKLSAEKLKSTAHEDKQLVDLTASGTGLSLERSFLHLDANGKFVLEKSLRGQLKAQRAINQATPALVILATGAAVAGFPARNKACSTAADGFKLYSQQENPPNSQDFVDKAASFRANCLATLDANSNSTIAVSAASGRFIDPQVVGRALGVLIVGVTPVCTATLIGSKRVLTAAHCLRNNRGALTLLGSELQACARDPTNCVAFFARASDPGNLLPLTPIEDLSNQPLWWPSTDFVTLNLARAVLDVPAVVKVAASASSPQFLAGWSGFLEGTEGGPWSALMMYTSVDWPCAIHQAWSHTALHSCQTLRGFSGAPLIHRTLAATDGTPYGTIEITGIQARFSTKQDWIDASQPTPTVAEAARWNVAVTSISW